MRKILLLLLLLSTGLRVQAFHIAIDPGASRLEQLIVHGESILGNEWRILYLDGRENYGYAVWDDANYAVINIEIIRFANQAEENDYFQYDRNMIPYFDAVLANYMPYEILNSCSQDDLMLHEISGHLSGTAYDIRVYHRAIGSSIVRTVGLYFPDYRSQDLEEYASRFYPDLLSCPDEELH